MEAAEVRRRERESVREWNGMEWNGMEWKGNGTEKQGREEEVGH